MGGHGLQRVGSRFPGICPLNVICNGESTIMNESFAQEIGDTLQLDGRIVETMP